MSPRPGKPGDSIHVPFLVASLLIGTFGGFTLAVTLPVEMLIGHPDVSWVAHAQVHGHLQAVGFAGLFVLGMAHRLAPRFGGGRLSRPELVRPAFVLLVAGLLLRAAGQPLADHPLFAVLLALGALAELAGSAMFVVIFLGTLAPALRSLQPPAILLFSAVCWLAIQAALGSWWLSRLARDGGVALSYSQNLALVNLQVFGVILSAILGVGMRTFPTFFGMPAPRRDVCLSVAALQGLGIALWTGGVVAPAGDAGSALVDTGMVLVGLAVLGAVAVFGLGRLRHRMAPASRGYVWALQPMLFWLALTGIALAAGGIKGLAVGDGLAPTGLDGVRHMFTLGVVTLAIVTVGQLILPEFASERIAHPPPVWRGAAFSGALSVAALLRGALPWAGLSEGDDHYRAMAVAGVLGLAAAGSFTFLYFRARRRHIEFTRRIAAMRARGEGLTVVEAAR